MSGAVPKLKLTYFGAPGRAEPTRLALTIGNIPFEDDRLTWEEFGKRKETFPYKQVPVLEVNGEVMTQSMAMLRYAGVLGGLYPNANALDAYRVDEVIAYLEDIFNTVIPSFMEKDETKKLAMRKLLTDTTLPPMFALFEARLNKTKGTFILGDKISIGDIAIYCNAGAFKSGKLDGIPSSILDKYPRINAIFNAVHKHPKVQEWNSKHQ